MGRSMDTWTKFILFWSVFWSIALALAISFTT